MMQKFSGLNENDYNVLIFAVNKLDIKGSEAATIVMLLDKLQKEQEFLRVKEQTEQPKPSSNFESKPTPTIHEVDGELMLSENE